MPYYAYLYEKAPDAEIPVVATSATGSQCKPGVSTTTGRACAALAAAMAERAAITIYQRPPPSKFRSPEPPVKNYRNSQDAISAAASIDSSGAQAPPRRYPPPRRQSDFASKRTSLHQVHRRNSLFLSIDRDLELASSNFNFNNQPPRQQRLSSIISSEEYEEQDEQNNEIIPNSNAGK